jgi:A/G-specific adenine glycosylase
LPGAKPRLREAAASLTPEMRAGDYAQAVMDLGATICTPRRPRCMICPWAARCAARRGDPEAFPARAPKNPRPRRHGIAFLVLREDGAVWLRRRPEQGLLGGMLEVPSTEWTAESPEPGCARKVAPAARRWREAPGTVVHVFTHFELDLKVWLARPKSKTVPDNYGLWIELDELGSAAIPSVMRKVISHGLKHATMIGSGR